LTRPRRIATASQTRRQRRPIAYAIGQPADVDINEIVLRPAALAF
jgi:hypothetical protein